MAGGTSSLLRHAGVWMGLAAATLAVSAPASGATPAPEPTPEAKAVPSPDPAPSPLRTPSASTTPRRAVTPRGVATRVERAPAFSRRQTARRAAKSAAKPAAPVKRSAVRKHRGAPPAVKAKPVVFERQPPRNPPLTFVSAPVLFPDERSTAVMLAAFAVLALFGASASHLGLLYAVWKRVA